MPTFPRLVVFVMLLTVSGRAWSQNDDRYGDWRGGSSEPNQPLEPAPAAEVPATEATSPEPAWQDPPRTLRRLPFRFEQGTPRNVDSKVILASVSEPVSKAISKPQEAKPLPLKSRGESSKSRSHSNVPSGSTLAGSVAVVVGLFLIVAWVARRSMPKQPPTLPREALEVLGRQRFGGKQEMQLLRVGHKLVLIHVVSGHVEALTEITDPEEVDRLTGICYQTHPYSSTRNFQQTMQQFTSERPAPRRSVKSASDKLDLSFFDNLASSPAKSV